MIDIMDAGSVDLVFGCETFAFLSEVVQKLKFPNNSTLLKKLTLSGIKKGSARKAWKDGE